VTDPYNLQRFLDAQNDIYETAIAELRDGMKRSHWMWFIFPQLRGLGFSPTALFFGIASIEEAHAYIDHVFLGARLRQCVEAILPWAESRSAEQILGSIDAMKLRSSLTLFDQVEPGTLFAIGLAAFYRGARDERTLALLNCER
jgi:uncharacterized protein (DUF1810 family)